MTEAEVRKIILDNSSNIAFIIGNGIHRYNNNSSLSWDRLLLVMWRAFSTESVYSIPQGISHTEFYDTLELEYLKQPIDRRTFSEVVKETTSLKSTQLRKYSQKDLIEIFRKQQEQAIHNQDAFKSHVEKLRLNDRSLKTLVDEPNMDEIHSFVQLGEKYDKLRVSIMQRAIVKDMSSWQPLDHHRSIINKIRAWNTPILTTNYDEVLSCSDSNMKYFQIEKRNFSSKHPWSGYFGSANFSDPLDGFGIWHINGQIKYPESIKLGMCQYMESVEKARRMIQAQNKYEMENFGGKNRNDWDGKNTWLHLIFNRSLFVFGLALDENEIFLRWLLIQRAKYFALFPDREYKGWYLTTEAEMKDKVGKKFFLENVGLKVITVSDYDKIYVDIWQ